MPQNIYALSGNVHPVGPKNTMSEPEHQLFPDDEDYWRAVDQQYDPHIVFDVEEDMAFDYSDY